MTKKKATGKAKAKATGKGRKPARPPLEIATGAELHELERQAATPETRREVFCLHYAAHGNGTQAAIAAGFAPLSAHVTASRLLRDAKVAARLAELRRPAIAKLERRAGASLDRLVVELEAIALADPAACFRVPEALPPPAIDDPDGERAAPEARLLEIHEMPEAIRRAIASFKVRRVRRRGTDDPWEEQLVEVKLWDKGAMIVAGLKRLGAFPRDVRIGNVLVQFAQRAESMQAAELEQLLAAGDDALLAFLDSIEGPTTHNPQSVK